MPGSPQSEPIRHFEREVEGLRGLAALMVLYTHLFASNHDVDPGFSPSPLFTRFEAGQGAVLAFFVLSGYVIGLTNLTAFTGSACRSYLGRRFIRLVPLYWLAIALSVAALPLDTWRTILGNVFFLQNDLGYGVFHIPVLLANTNLWSLNYEALYYLLFILIWSRSSGFVRPMIVACILTGLGIAIPGFPPLLANYATGWMFWLAGYGLSLTAKDKTSAARWPWPSLLLLGLAT